MKMMRKTLAMLLVLALALCLAPAAFADAAPDGSRDNPYIVESGWFEVYLAEITKSGEPTYFQTTIGSTGYFGMSCNGVFMPEDTWTELEGVLEVDVTVEKANGDWFSLYFTPDEMGNQLFPTSFEEGETVLIEVVVLDENYDIISGFVDLMGIFGGSHDAPFTLETVQGNASTTVSNGATVYYQNMAWNNFQGAIITATNPYAISDKKTVIHMNGKTYDDADGDGQIEITLEADASSVGRPTVILGIENNSGISRPFAYNIKFTGDPQMECTHANAITVDAKDPDSCHVNGNIAHKACPDCGELFDLDGNSITNVIVKAPNADKLVLIPGQEAGCESEGLKDHWFCSGCNTHFADEQGTEAISDLSTLIIPAAGHTLVEFPAEDPTCCQPGSTGYFFCMSFENPCCWKYFRDAEGTQEITEAEAIIPIDYENPNHVLGEILEVIEYPTCTKPGKALYNCDECMMYGGVEAEMPIDETAHELEHHEASDTAIEHWSCKHCGKLFADNDGVNELDPDDLIPPTGEVPVTLAAALALFSMSSILALVKKRED